MQGFKTYYIGPNADLDQLADALRHFNTALRHFNTALWHFNTQPRPEDVERALDAWLDRKAAEAK